MHEIKLQGFIYQLKKTASKSDIYLRRYDLLKQCHNYYAKQEQKTLSSNEHVDSYGSYEALVAVSRQTNGSVIEVKNIDKTQKFIDEQKDWLFGFISYDFKNELEDLQSNNLDELDFPELYFFCPEKIILIKENKAEFLYLKKYENQVDEDFASLTRNSSPFHHKSSDGIRIQMRIHKDAYFEKVSRMLEHIHRGDIYEANFCQEFYSTESTIDPWYVYQNLNAISLSPFASFLRLGDKYLLCASPERYLKRERIWRKREGWRRSTRESRARWRGFSRK